MPRILIADLIKKDLGYCCEWFFFRYFRRTAEIAARLGVDKSTVRKHKAAAKCGSCEKAENCLEGRITLPRVRPPRSRPPSE